jgi:capsule polysaccharide export protein KpsC/LpsZ
LIVKVHPAEVVIGTNQSFVDIIDNKIEHIPSNVRIIPPQEKINSWSVCDITDLGLVHTTTVGMELPILGIPAVVVSKTHFRGKGFTVDPSSKTEYFKYLKEFDRARIDRSELKTLSKRYAYLLFERYQLPFDFTFTNGHYSNVCALKLDKLTDITNDPIVQFIIKCLEAEQPFVLPD